MRVALVQVVTGHFDHAGFVKKPLVDGAWFVRLGVQPLFDVHQQNLVELRHRFGRPVVAAHQGLTRTHGQVSAVGADRFVAESCGDGGLQVKHQAILAPLRCHVQAQADELEQCLIALDLLDLKRCGQAIAREFVPALAQARRLSHPQDYLQVAQAAGRLFAVGLQRVGRVLKLVVALAQL